MKILLLIATLFLFPSGSSTISPPESPYSVSNFKSQAAKALEFCKSEKMNTEWCILFDGSIHSGKNRLVLWDFKKDTIIEQGLCSHGCCDGEWSYDGTKDSPTFSNTHESYCSSLGKYKIGTRGYSNWGINVNYKLHGLESSNSNAYKRLIVLHSWDDVSEREVYPQGTPEGWGCPALSNKLMRKVDARLKQAKMPVLLWMYN